MRLAFETENIRREKVGCDFRPRLEYAKGLKICDARFVVDS